MYCNDLLEDENFHFCKSCFGRIVICDQSSKWFKASTHSMEISILLMTTDLSIFIHKATKRLDVSFLAEILAPLYHYKASLLGWEEYTVLSDNSLLKKAFSKLQTKRRKERLFLSLEGKENLDKAKLPRAEKLICLIDSGSF